MTLSTRPHLTTLPVVVTGPGNYLTRDGRKVVVHEVKDARCAGAIPPVTEYLVKGTLFTPRPDKADLARYDIWHVSGYILDSRERDDDIVSVA